MRYKIVIVDEEPLAIEVLKHYLKEEKDMAILSSFTNPLQALAFLNTNEVDLLFLDMQMAVLHGIDLLKQIQKRPFIVFTTAYPQYLQEGFDQGGDGLFAKAY